MKAELIIESNRKIALSSFNKELDGSGCAKIELISSQFTYSNEEFYFDDFDKFIADLDSMYTDLSGTAELRFHHESSYIKFEAKSLGHIELTGEFLEYGEIHQNLSFGFTFDQSYLPSFIDSLKSVMTEM
jgi:hypothetical protein